MGHTSGEDSNRNISTSNSDQNPPKSDSNSNNNTEEEGESLPPLHRMSDSEKRIFAHRRYHGIGEDGRFIKEWTQQRIASYLDISRQSINRWLNREESPLVEGWSQYERLILYGLVLQGNEDTIEEYLLLRKLEKKSESRVSSEEGDEEQSLVPEGFSW